METSHPTTLIYRFCRFLCFVILKLGWRLETKQADRVPKTGPIIVAANHRSYADPPLVGVSLERPLHFLAKKELFSFKPFGWLISNLNAHPLDRGGGAVGALRAAQKLLEEGHAVILFPEGKRSKTDEFQKPKAGVGMLSITTQTPVVPAYIHNSGHMKDALKIQVIFGKPIHPHSFHSYQAMADEVMRQIQKLKEQLF